MHAKAKAIISDHIMLSRGNRSKKLREHLQQELRNFKMMPQDTEFADIFDSLGNNKSTEHYIYGNLFPTDFYSVGRKPEIGYCGDVAA